MDDQRLPIYHLNPRRPALKLPAGSWNTHCHVLGPKARFPFASTTTIDPGDATKETLFALHDLLGIERCVIVQSAVHGMDNGAVEEALAATGGAYLGIALAPVDVDIAELRRLDAAGFRGVRFNFMKHLHKSAGIDEVIGMTPKLAEIGWHLQVHMEGDWIDDLTPALSRSAAPVVIDHIGRVDARKGLEQKPFQDLLRLLERPHFWVKVSGVDRITGDGPPYADALPFARQLVQTFPDNVVWGTDWPHPHHKGPVPDDGELVDLIGDIAPGAMLLHKLMVDNPVRLYEQRAG